MKSINLIPVTGNIFSEGLNSQKLVVFGDRTLNLFNSHITHFMEKWGVDLKVDINNVLPKKIGNIESIFWSTSNITLEFYLHIIYQLLLKCVVTDVGILVPKLTKNVTDQVRVETLDQITILRTITKIQELISGHPDIPLKNVRLYSLSESLHKTIPQSLVINQIDLNYNRKSMLMDLGCYLLSERKVVFPLIQRKYNIDYDHAVNLIDELVRFGVVEEFNGDYQRVLVSGIFQLKDKLSHLFQKGGI